MGYYWLALVALASLVRKFVMSGNDASVSPSRILEITPSRLLFVFRYWRSVAEWDDRMYRCAVVEALHDLSHPDRGNS